MAAIGEPVETGLVASLARPGGNVTGLSAFVTELVAKRVELLREVIPQIARLSLLDNMSNRSVPPQWEETKRAAGALGIEPQLLDVRKTRGSRARIRCGGGAARRCARGGQRQRRHRQPPLASPSWRRSFRLPAIYATREFVDSGGLLSYAAHYPDLYRRAAAYVDKIFKGEKPADLPVEQPTKFEMVSASRPPRRSASTSRRRCSPAPTR